MPAWLETQPMQHMFKVRLNKAACYQTKQTAVYLDLLECIN
jgi:hypothetical protein